MPSLSHSDPVVPTRARLWTHRLALLLSAATLVLLAAGALVVGTGSSLAVPDWPLAYGQVFPPMVGGILFEHGHRLIASSVGLLTVILAAWLWFTEPRRWVAGLGMAALGIVILQGVLGGITVLLLLPKPISISHALLAQMFFATAVILAQVTAPGWEALAAKRGTAPGGIRGLAGVTALLVLATELLGAVVRHNNAGLAIPDFPLAYGGLIPPLSAFPVLIHFLHRVGALAATLAVLWTVWRVRKGSAGWPALQGPAWALLVFLLLQVGLGAGVIWTQRELLTTTAHLVNGALLLGSATLLTLRAWVLEAPVRGSARSGAMHTDGAR
jgi:cytochrome c oxidase assembly protein subunit 15